MDTKNDPVSGGRNKSLKMLHCVAQPCYIVLCRNNATPTKEVSMTASVIGTDKWSGYRQARYIRLIERITGKPCVEFAVVEGNLS